MCLCAGVGGSPTGPAAAGRGRGRGRPAARKAHSAPTEDCTAAAWDGGSVPDQAQKRRRKQQKRPQPPACGSAAELAGALDPQDAPESNHGDLAAALQASGAFSGTDWCCTGGAAKQALSAAASSCLPRSASQPASTCQRNVSQTAAEEPMDLTVSSSDEAAPPVAPLPSSVRAGRARTAAAVQLQQQQQQLGTAHGAGVAAAQPAGDPWSLPDLAWDLAARLHQRSAGASAELRQEGAPAPSVLQGRQGALEAPAAPAQLQRLPAGRAGVVHLSCRDCILLMRSC